MKTNLLPALAALLATAAAPATSPHYTVTGTIVGPDGGWDYARIDPEKHRLYIARTDSVTVVDLDKQAALSSIGHLVRGHAVMPIGGGRLMVTSGNDASVRFFNAQDGSELANIAVGKKADAAIYDATRNRAFVMNADDGTISVIDLAGMSVAKTIKVKSALEYAVLAKDGMLFINDEDANEMEVVDVEHGKLVTSIAMPGCEGPTGLGYDAAHDRLISSCANGKAVVVNAQSRHVVGTIDIGKGADAVIVDIARERAFIPCGEDGVLDILSLAGSQITKVSRVTTERGARTGALDPTTGTVYLPTAKFAPPVKAGARPTPVPGSFHILTIRPT